MKNILLGGIPNSGLTAVAIEKFMTEIGVPDYRITETRFESKEDSYAIPIFVIGIEMEDEAATVVTLRYSDEELIHEIRSTRIAIINNLQTHERSNK
jgi:hypothetical protein